jgi:hypothetical protein
VSVTSEVKLDVDTIECRPTANEPMGVSGRRTRSRSRSDARITITNEPFREWLTAAEAADYLRLPSVDALYQRRARGQVRAFRMGRGDRGPLRFKRRDLEALMHAA